MEHKYGKQVGEVSEDTLDTVLNTTRAVLKVKSLGITSVAKAGSKVIAKRINSDRKDEEKKSGEDDKENKL